jgi:DNA-binding MarR family transcriptional regulator
VARSSTETVAPGSSRPADDGRASASDAVPSPDYELIELLFFAYRDFVSDPDRMLGDYSFGRAHHRILHFVGRQAGLTIAELLDILRITKQSLNRVLKELIRDGFVEQRAGVTDRRQRLLFLTEKGKELALAMSEVQQERIARALAKCDPGTREAALRFLFAMIDPDDSAHVARLVWKGAAPRP